MFGRLVRFAAVGAFLTAVSYLTFLLLLAAGVHYLSASALCWALGVAMSYVLNKQVTFALTTPVEIGEVGRFVLGCVLQLVLSLAGYAILIGAAKLEPTPAFVLNTAATALFSFAFMRSVVFREPLTRAAKAHV